MERLIVFFAFCCQENLVCSDIRVVSAGDTVLLHCHESVWIDRIVWFGQRMDEVPFIILAKENNQPRYFLGYDKRFSIVNHPNTKNSSLKIYNITDSDLGLYYCAINFGISMTMGSYYKLILAENSTPPLSTVSHHPATCTDPSDLSKTLVAGLIPALVVGLFSCACFCFYTICRRPAGDKKQETDTQQNDQDEKDGMEENEEVIYTAIYINQGCSQPKTGSTRV